MRQKGSGYRFAILFLLIILVFVGFRWFNGSKTTGVISPIADNETPKQSIIKTIFSSSQKKSPEELEKKVKALIDNRWVNYSVLVDDYNSDFYMGLNESIIYTAASVNKIPILASLYYKAQQGEIDLDKRITIQEKDIQNYGTGSIRYDTPGSSYSIKTLAKLMIQQSDNTAAYVLSNYVLGLDTIQTLINSWGLTQTDMVNNKTSNKDMAIAMEKIYTGKLANASSTQEMLAFFKDTDFEDRLPALLPKNVVVYHKIGNEIAILHDVGIIEEGQTKYYLGILVGDVVSEEETIQIMAQISKTVYDFMKS